jgi:ethanolamine ammonia-lyase large subunit
MGVPGADDIMLNYQSTSFHDALYARRQLGLSPAPEFAAWLERTGVFRDGRLKAPKHSLHIPDKERLRGLSS